MLKMLDPDGELREHRSTQRDVLLAGFLSRVSVHKAIVTTIITYLLYKVYVDSMLRRRSEHQEEGWQFRINTWSVKK